MWSLFTFWYDYVLEYTCKMDFVSDGSQLFVMMLVE